MKRFMFAIALIGSVWYLTGAPTADAAPCLVVTLTGTMGGPPNYNGLAGPGTDGNQCVAARWRESPSSHDT
jgi:ribonuclease Z